MQISVRLSVRCKINLNLLCLSFRSVLSQLSLRSVLGLSVSRSLKYFVFFPLNYTALSASICICAHLSCDMRSRYLRVSQFPSQLPVIREQAGHYLDDGKWIFSLLHFLRMKIAPRVLCIIAHLISLFWLRVRCAALLPPLTSSSHHNALWSSWSRGNISSQFKVSITLNGLYSEWN